MDKGIVYNSEDKNLIGYVDADWAGDKKDRRSYTGYVYSLSGGPIVWESRKQKTIAQSTTEAEYMSLTESSKEAMFLRNLYQEIFGSVPNVKLCYDEKIKLFCDNNGAIELASNPGFRARSKHIEIKHHFVREVLNQNIIELKHVNTEYMVADVLTKGLAKEKHEFCVKNMLKNIPLKE